MKILYGMPTHGAFQKAEAGEIKLGGCCVIVGGEEETNQKTIRSETSKKFIEELKMVNLLNWKAKYIEPGVLDGTQWSVEIIRDERNIKKYGDNQFPNEWDMFCEIIKKMIGKNCS